jgi:hypothetical protein
LARRCKRDNDSQAVSRSPDEDQQLGPTVDGGLHRVRDPTIPAALSPTNRAGQLSSSGCLHLDRWIDFAAIRFGDQLQVIVTEL